MGWNAVLGGAVLFGLLDAAAAAHHADAATEPRSLDTGRFYLLIEAGNTFQAFDHFGGDVDIDTPDGIDFILGGGAGYNLTDHWGVEIQAHGIEPDLRSASRGKVKELSNITLMPAVRFRIPFLDGRLVTYGTAGFGWSMSDLNDTGKPKTKLEMDEQGIAGSLGAGVEYFVAEDIAFGIGARYFVHPDADTTTIFYDSANREVSHDDSSVNLSNVALLASMRFFLGQTAAPGRERRLFFADRGPFDTDDTRFYLYGIAGHTFVLDRDFGGPIELEAPGDFNATLGGGLGVNLDGHWGFEIQMLNTEPNLDAGLQGGKFAEISTFTVMPSLRYRFPLWAGRLVPFALAGLGAAFYDINDARELADNFIGTGFQAGKTPIADIDGSSIAGMIGIGIEYFLNRHLSVGFSVPYYFYPDVDTFVQARFPRPQPPVHGSANFSGPAALLRLSAYLP